MYSVCVFNAFKVTTAVLCAANLKMYALISLCQRNLKESHQLGRAKGMNVKEKKERKGKNGYNI